MTTQTHFPAFAAGAFPFPGGSLIRDEFGVNPGSIRVNSGSIRSQFGLNSGSIPGQFGMDSGSIRPDGVDSGLIRWTAVDGPTAVPGQPPSRFFPVRGVWGGEASPGKERLVTCVEKEMFFFDNVKLITCPK